MNQVKETEKYFIHTVLLDACNRMCTRRHTHKSTCAISRINGIIVFSFFVFLLLYISCKEKFFIEGFFIEDSIQEI